MSTYANELVALPSGSPRWLQIARDAVWTIIGLLVILGAIYTAVALNSAGNALEDAFDPASTSAPCPPENPYCVPIRD